MKKAFITLSVPLFLMIFGCAPANRGEYVTLDGFAQGSTYHIVYNTGSDSAATLKAEIEALIPLWFEQIDKSVSGYDSCSIISKINRNEPVIPDSIFIDIFNFSKEFYAISNGAVDAASAPLFDLWGFGFAEKESMTQQKIDSIKQFTGMQMFGLKEEPCGRHITKRDSRARLNFNAVAQGYSCDFFARHFDKMGVTDYMIEIGGEIFCRGKNSGNGEWRVGIDRPVEGNNIAGNDLQAILRVTEKGVVTSGNYRKFYIENGKKYSHTIDPITGRPVEHNLLSATVIADNATIADAYATYFMVLGVEKSRKILEKSPRLEAMLVYGDNENMKVYMTEGFKKAALRR